MSQRSKERNELVINYLLLRKTVGWIGTLLPVVLIAGNVIFFSTDLPGSMSAYYYTHMRNVFVGALCALGVFLIAYAGYDDWDRWITNIAGIGAIGVALFATKPTVCPVHARTCAPPAVRAMTTTQNIVGTIHLGFAMIAFCALGVMALRFAKLPPTTAPRPPGIPAWCRSALGLPHRGTEDQRSAADKRSGAIFRGCGIAILLCVVLAILSNFLPSSVKNAAPVLFIFEALAVFAFGVSWFVKGQTLTPTIRRIAAQVGMRRAPTPVPAEAGPVG